MTKRLILSFAMIALTIAGVTSATMAYWSAGRVLGATTGYTNTFTTGSVKLDDAAFQGLPLNITGMAPGVAYATDANIQYNGSLPADLYLGVAGAAHNLTDANYFGNVLWLTIYDNADTSVLFNGYVSGLSAAWSKIATNIGQNAWKSYHMVFTLDANAANLYEGQTNSDTALMFYAVQTGGPAPTPGPYDQFLAGFPK